MAGGGRHGHNVKKSSAEVDAISRKLDQATVERKSQRILAEQQNRINSIIRVLAHYEAEVRTLHEGEGGGGSDCRLHEFLTFYLTRLTCH